MCRYWGDVPLPGGPFPGSCFQAQVGVGNDPHESMQHRYRRWGNLDVMAFAECFNYRCKERHLSCDAGNISGHCRGERLSIS